MLKKKTIRRIRTALRNFPAEPRTRNTPSAKRRYGKRELDEFKTIILSMRDETVVDIQELQRSVQSMDPAIREESALLLNRQIKLLGYLDGALQRLDRGDFGRCRTCGALIDRERLLVVPHTIQCVQCKTGVSQVYTPTHQTDTPRKGPNDDAL
jgi:RNA polymerase-binding transcription factor DksA